MRLLISGLVIWVTCSAMTLNIENEQNTRSVIFSGKAQPKAVLRENGVIVKSRNGDSLYTADSTFIRGVTHNSSLLIQEWLPDSNLVRISITKPEVWVSCDELQEMPIACSELKFDVNNTGSIHISQCEDDVECGRIEVTGSIFKRIPNCPGSSLCPKP